MKPYHVPGNPCQFCISNGESEEQYRSHQLKTVDGRVSCPILRAFVCPHCKATGDHAHTERYCPLNRDGRLNSTLGASLADLKRKKNAAGKTFKSKWPQPSYPTDCPPSPKPLLVVPTNFLSTKTPPGPVKRTPLQTKPGPGLLSTSDQLALHHQYLQFYREKCIQHQNIIEAFAYLHADALYTKTMASPPPASTFTSIDFRDQKNLPGYNTQLMGRDLELDQLLAELREGSEEFEG